MGLCAVVLVLASACSRTSAGLAVVGGQSITIEELAGFVALQTGQPFERVPPEVTAALFEVFLEEAVILAAAGAPGDRRLPAAVRSARARDLLATQCPPPPLPTIREAEEYLVSQGEFQPGGERLRLRQLILPDLGAARSVRQRLLRGEEFEALSASVSRAPNAAEGGMLGWFERQQLPPEFEAAVFGLQAGQVSQPVASNAGWHLFQVVERENGTTSPGAAAIGRARAELAARIARRQEFECIRALAARVGTEVHCQQAPFPCRNPFQEKP